MHPTEFECPHCSALLRVRDRQFVGRTVDCPDCGEPVQLLPDGVRGIAVLPAESGAKATSPRRKKKTRRPVAETPPRNTWLTPGRVSSVVAIVLVLIVVTIVAWPGGKSPTNFTQTLPPLTINSNETVAPVAPKPAADNENEQPASADPAPPTADDENDTPIPEAIPLPDVLNDVAAIEPIAAPTEVAEATRNPEPNQTDAPPDPAAVPEVNANPDSAEPLVANAADPKNEPTDNVPGPADSVTVAPEPDPEPPIDIHATLNVTLVSFRQDTPATVRNCLRQMEELVGTRFDIDESVPPAALDLEVTYALRQATVSQILDTVLEKAGLFQQVEDNRIIIRMAKTGSGETPK